MDSRELLSNNNQAMAMKRTLLAALLAKGAFVAAVTEAVVATVIAKAGGNWKRAASCGELGQSGVNCGKEMLAGGRLTTDKMLR